MTVQEAGLTGAADPVVLEWAAAERRVLLTHDVATIPRFAYERIAQGRSVPGVFEVPRSLGITRALEDISLLTECSLENEWEGQVRFLPL